MTTELFLSLLAGGIINGLVTYGVVKTTLRYHEQGIAEAKVSASKAHERIDAMIININKRQKI